MNSKNDSEIDLGQIPPSILLSMKANPCNWSTVLGELVDNAFDSNATRVDVSFGRREMEVLDDGAGCADIEKMLTIGAHFRQTSTRLGRYGVGLKDAACWLWGQLEISTAFDGVLHNARVDWDALSRSKTWKLVVPKAKATSSTGTKLVFRNFIRSSPDYDAIAEQLGYIFAPAILMGRQIRISRPKKPTVCIRPWQMPDVTNHVNERFEINGKRVHLVAGIVPEGQPNERSGLNFCHAHRMICNTSFGACGRSTTRISGIVTLDEAWTLSRNKTEIVDVDADDLESSIYQSCKEMLLKAESEERDKRTAQLENSVTQMLRAMISDGVMEKRSSPSNKTGGVSPKNTGRKRQPTGKTQPRPDTRDRLAGKVRMEWVDRQDGLIGTVDVQGAVVKLNGKHPRMAHHKRHENCDALADACVTLIAHEEMERQERSKLFKNYSGFMEALSSTLVIHQNPQGK